MYARWNQSGAAFARTYEMLIEQGILDDVAADVADCVRRASKLAASRVAANSSVNGGEAINDSVNAPDSSENSDIQGICALQLALGEMKLGCVQNSILVKVFGIKDSCSATGIRTGSDS